MATITQELHTKATETCQMTRERYDASGDNGSAVSLSVYRDEPGGKLYRVSWSGRKAGTLSLDAVNGACSSNPWGRNHRTKPIGETEAHAFAAERITFLRDWLLRQ